MRRLDLINLLLLLALAGASVMVWPALPDQLPRHFDGRGEVDGWTRTSPGSWFLLPVLAGVTLLVLEVSARLSLRRPELVSLPSKKQFLELPAEEQKPIVAEIVNFIRVVGTMVLVLFGTIQLATYRAALGESVKGLMLFVLLLGIGMGPVLAIVLLVRTGSLVSEAHRRAKLRGSLRQ